MKTTQAQSKNDLNLRRVVGSNPNGTPFLLPRLFFFFFFDFSFDAVSIYSICLITHFSG